MTGSFRAVMVAAVTAVVTGGSAPDATTGRVVDVVTRRPVPHAIVTRGHAETSTSEDGTFSLPAHVSGPIRVRAYGYRRAEVVPGLRVPEITLVAFQPKALYLSMFGVASRTLREPALALIDATELNAVVIDVKGDRGWIAYRSATPLTSRAGAQRMITIPDLPALIASLRQRGIYTIARIVAFKDDRLASARPELAVRRGDGTVFRDREGLAWTDSDRCGGPFVQRGHRAGGCGGRFRRDPVRLRAAARREGDPLRWSQHQRGPRGGDRRLPS